MELNKTKVIIGVSALGVLVIGGIVYMMYQKNRREVAQASGANAQRAAIIGQGISVATDENKLISAKNILKTLNAREQDKINKVAAGTWASSMDGAYNGNVSNYKIQIYKLGLSTMIDSSTGLSVIVKTI